MPEINENDVWLHIYELGEASYTNLIKKFVESGKCAKQTLLTYKKGLEKEGKIRKKISEKTGRPVYYVPEEWRGKVEALRRKKKLLKSFEGLPPEKQEEYVRKLEKELKYYKSLWRIQEIEEALWHTLAPEDREKLEKELENLKIEVFEYEWLALKEKCEVSDEDWRKIGAIIAYDKLVYGGRFLPLNTALLLECYSHLKKGKIDEFKKYIKERWGSSEETTEKTVVFMVKTILESPVEEVWRDPEDLPIDEWGKRVYQYLRNKYAK